MPYTVDVNDANEPTDLREAGQGAEELRAIKLKLLAFVRDINGSPNFGNNLLFLDYVNNRVGVNNATPSTDFDVDGSALISSNLQVGESVLIGNDNNYLAQDSGGNPRNLAGIDTSDNLYFGAVTVGWGGNTSIGSGGELDFLVGGAGGAFVNALNIDAVGILSSLGGRVYDETFHPEADVWTTPREISFTGAVTGTATVDGSQDVAIAMTYDVEQFGLILDQVTTDNEEVGVQVTWDPVEQKLNFIVEALGDIPVTGFLRSDVQDESEEMKIFSASYDGLPSKENSPMQIREMGKVEDAQTVDAYAPRINFNWEAIIDKDLLMDSSGNLKWGTDQLATTQELEDAIGDIPQPGVASFAFDPNDELGDASWDSTLALSDSNRTMSVSGTNGGMILTTEVDFSGKTYFEYDGESLGGYGITLGLVNKSHLAGGFSPIIRPYLNDGGTDDLGTPALYFHTYPATDNSLDASENRVLLGTSHTLNGGPSPGYTIYGFAVDMDAGYVWVRIKDVAGWLGGGDPETGVSPSFTFTPSAAYNAISVYVNGGSTASFNVSPALGATPAGFRALSGSAAGFVDKLGDTMLGHLATLDPTVGFQVAYEANGAGTVGPIDWTGLIGGENATGLDSLNTANILTDWGFAVVNSHAGDTVPQGSPAFSVDARSGDLHIFGNVQVYNGGSEPVTLVTLDDVSDAISAGEGVNGRVAYLPLSVDSSDIYGNSWEEIGDITYVPTEGGFLTGAADMDPGYIVSSAGVAETFGLNENSWTARMYFRNSGSTLNGVFRLIGPNGSFYINTDTSSRAIIASSGGISGNGSTSTGFVSSSTSKLIEFCYDYDLGLLYCFDDGDLGGTINVGQIDFGGEVTSVQIGKSNPYEGDKFINHFELFSGVVLHNAPYTPPAQPPSDSSAGGIVVPSNYVLIDGDSEKTGNLVMASDYIRMNSGIPIQFGDVGEYAIVESAGALGIAGGSGGEVVVELDGVAQVTIDETEANFSVPVYAPNLTIPDLAAVPQVVEEGEVSLQGSHTFQLPVPAGKTAANTSYQILISDLAVSIDEEEIYGYFVSSADTDLAGTYKWAGGGWHSTGSYEAANSNSDTKIGFTRAGANAFSVAADERAELALNIKHPKVSKNQQFLTFDCSYHQPSNGALAAFSGAASLYNAAAQVADKFRIAPDSGLFSFKYKVIAT